MGTFADYESFDGLGLAELIRTRRIEPKELLEAAIARVLSAGAILLIATAMVEAVHGR